MATSAAPAATGGDSHILREYLVALGFRVDETRHKQFTNTVTRLDKFANSLGHTLVGVGTAAVGMAVLFTRSMERLFYNARYADTTVAKLQALEFAGRNIGLAGGEMTAGLKSMATAIRSNPGLVGLLEKLGVPVKGREGRMDQIMIDFVRATKGMPPYVAQQFAEMFGISPEMLFNLQQGVDELEKAAKLREQMAKDMGVDPDELAKSSVEISNIWRGLTEHATVFGQAVLQDALPFVRDLAGASHELLNDWKGISSEIAKRGTEDFWHRVGEGLGVTDAPGTRATLTEEQKRRIGAPLNDLGPRDAYEVETGHERRWKRLLRRFAPGMFGHQVAKDADAVDAVTDLDSFRSGGAGETDPGGTDEPGFDPQEYLHSLERKYGLPYGLLDRVWRRESSRGQHMLSPAGAKGHFGFMQGTAKQYGVAGQENDFTASADASARYWRDLLKQFGGDTRKAAAAYNWGPGNVTRLGMDRMPQETRGYADDVGSVGDVNVNTEIHVHGVTDPARAADLTKQKQSDVASDVVRNMSPRVR